MIVNPRLFNTMMGIPVLDENCLFIAPGTDEGIGRVGGLLGTDVSVPETWDRRKAELDTL